MNRLIFADLLAACLCFWLGCCDKLDDGGDGIVKEVLPGKWSLSYSIGDEVGTGRDISQYVTFMVDGTCTLTLAGDASLSVAANDSSSQTNNNIMYGTWQATNQMIRITSSGIGGEEQVVLWRIISMSPKLITCEHDYSLNAQSLTATVILEKQD